MYGSACGNGYDNALDYGLPFFIKFDNEWQHIQT